MLQPDGSIKNNTAKLTTKVKTLELETKLSQQNFIRLDQACKITSSPT